MNKTLIKNKIIKMLGGYTKKEYIRLERRYQGLLDSKTNIDTVKITNEYILRTLKTLDKYARTTLYGLPANSWANKMYNIIHNNMLRLTTRYLYKGSASIYIIDTTLDNKNQFKDIIIEDNIADEQQFILETD